jgi:hypothetical protein
MSFSADVSCWSLAQNGLRLRLKVQPKARRSGILGVTLDQDGLALKVAVNAPPEDGKANAAAIALLAEALNVAKAAVSVVAGATGRRKLVEIRGNSKDLGARLDRLIKDLERNEHE